MLSQVLNASLRILTFRAGPQDFPYAPRLGGRVAFLAAAVNVIVFGIAAPLPLAMVAVAATMAGLALVTHGALRARELSNRFQQTFGALLVTTTILNVLLLPALLQVAPLLRTIADNPQLMEHPESLRVPAGAAFLLNLVNVWSFAVSAPIIRHAVDARLWVGVLIALTAALTVLFVIVLSSALVAALLGTTP
jgi:hypothetical protein